MLPLAAIAMLFVAGVVARQRGRLEPGQGRRLLRFVVNFGLPALILGSLSRVPLDPALIRLPVIAMTVSLIIGAAAWAMTRALRLERAAAGALVVSAMVMNLAFVFPFVYAAWGPAALARTVIFDVGNAVTTWSLVYFVAVRFGGGAPHLAAALGRVFVTPPFLAIAAAILINLLNVPVPEPLLQVLRVAGQGVTLLVVFAMGLLFEARRLLTGPVVAAVGLRCLAGLLIGGLLGIAFGLGESHKAVAMIGAAAPVGFSAVVMAEREGLDLGLATAAASLSALVGLVWLPVLLIALNP